jgi:DNA mismatch repair protein MSH6
LHYLDHTVTPFGKRLFRKWLCHPLMDINAISDRQDAVEEFIKWGERTKAFRTTISDLPDLERKISRMHTG